MIMHSRAAVTAATAVAAVGACILATGCQSGTTSAAGGGAAGASGTSGTATGEGAGAHTASSGQGGRGGTSGTGQGGTSANAAGGNSGAAGLARCATATLTMSVDYSQASGAAGSTYVPLDFANTSARACEMTGYPGVSFVTAANPAGHQIGAAAQRNPQYPATVVHLAPHARAHAWLQVAEAGNYPDTSCHPATAHGLRVYPPDQTRAGYVARDFPACALPSAGLLTIMPLRPGNGTHGSTP